jgi:hypothetical protein
VHMLAVQRDLCGVSNPFRARLFFPSDTRPRGCFSWRRQKRVQHDEPPTMTKEASRSPAHPSLELVGKIYQNASNFEARLSFRPTWRKTGPAIFLLKQATNPGTELPRIEHLSA